MSYGWTEEMLNEHRAKRAREAAIKDGEAAASLRPLEKDILDACLDFLRLHPKVAFAYRNNTGMMKATDAHGHTRYVKFGPVGSPDIVGMLKGGRALYCEVKRPNNLPSDEQEAFLAAVTKGGGLGCWVTSVEQLHLFLRDA